MTRDIDAVTAEVQRLVPRVQWVQWPVSHPGADDDGLWFFWLPECERDNVQVESSTGMCPFLIEGGPDDPATGDSVSDVAVKVAMRLQA